MFYKSYIFFFNYRLIDFCLLYIQFLYFIYVQDEDEYKLTKSTQQVDSFVWELTGTKRGRISNALGKYRFVVRNRKNSLHYPPSDLSHRYSGTTFIWYETKQHASKMCKGSVEPNVSPPLLSVAGSKKRKEQLLKIFLQILRCLDCKKLLSQFVKKNIYAGWCVNVINGFF